MPRVPLDTVMRIVDAPQVDSEWGCISKEPTVSPGVRTTAANMCYIIFTSGSTGRPKGTVLQHGSAVNFLFGTVRWAVDSGSCWQAVDMLCNQHTWPCAFSTALPDGVQCNNAGSWGWGLTTSSCRRSPSASTRLCW